MLFCTQECFVGRTSVVSPLVLENDRCRRIVRFTSEIMESPTQSPNTFVPVVTPLKGGTEARNGPNNWKHPYQTKKSSNNYLESIKSTSVTTSPTTNHSKWKQATTVHAELAALKQRGLAKILNQHFTETAQQLALEKAAADAALKDLEERKARTSEFHASTQTELSPLDQACIQANQWRAECRRKERETLLLYQRYVHKFGSTQVLPLPTVMSSSLPSHNKLPQAPPKPPATLVPNMAAQIETTLEEYCARGAIPHPSIITHGAEETYSSVAVKEECAFRDYYRRQLEAKGVDAVCSPGFFKGNGTLPDVFTRNVDDAILAGTVAAAQEMGEESERRGLGYEYMDYDDDLDMCSMVSGLTTLHSAMTREFLHDCENSVQTFLREEQEHVRKIMEDEDYDDVSDAHVSHAVQDSDATAQAAESMVQQMQEILQEFQKNHTITTASREEKLSEDAKKKYPRPYLMNSENEEWMVYYDEFYRQEYYHEVHTNRTQWDPPMDRDASYSHSSSTDVLSAHGNDDLFLLDDRMESIMEQSESRVLAYRRRQRRKRRRRRAIFALQTLLAVLLVTCGVYYWQCQFSSSVQEKPTTCAVLENGFQEQLQVFTSLVRSFTPIQVSQYSEMPNKPLQCALRFEDELAFASMIMAKQTEEAEQSQQQKVLQRRPWGCNIPLAYLFHPRCRRLAHQNPIFDLHSLINSMLQ